jgi:hypothetical protein
MYRRDALASTSCLHRLCPTLLCLAYRLLGGHCGGRPGAVEEHRLAGEAEHVRRQRVVELQGGRFICPGSHDQAFIRSNTVHSKPSAWS